MAQGLLQVYGVSKLYGVNDLVAHCSQQIEALVTPDNAAEMLVMMMQCQANDMYHFVLDFIVRVWLASWFRSLPSESRAGDWDPGL